MRVVREFVGFNLRGDGKEGEAERSIVCLARVDSLLVTMMSCLTEW